VADGKQRKGPRRIGGTLLSIVDKLDHGGRFEILRLVKVWPEVVGDAIARRTEVAGLKFHVATIRVSSAMWIQELGLMKVQILERLRAALGNDSVRDVRFVKGALSRRERRRLRTVPRHARHSIKLPEIKDPELKRAFESLIEAWGRAPR
jgi:predicted nucleic acid-binding Zn ribbon protein